MRTEQIERPPIIEEHIHKKIIEEVQPVLYRETVKPVVVEATRPIYEKVVEAPRLVEELRPMVDLGTKILGGETMPRSGMETQGPTAYIHEKVTVITKEPLAQGMGQGFGQQGLTGQQGFGQQGLTGQQGFGQTLGQNVTGQNQQFLGEKVPLATEGTKLSSTTTPTETRTI
jgi:hypothetical protein